MEYRAKYGLPEDKTVILFRGRFAHVKGVLETSYAAKYVVKNDPNMFFLFVGDGPLKHIVKNNLVGTKNVKIFDWTPPETVHELYIASDIYLLPSKWEALPITLMEAMAARLHIVSTPVGGVPDIINEYPLKAFITDFKVKTIIKALNKATGTTVHIHDANKISEYLKRFSWNNITYKLENIYINFIS